MTEMSQREKLHQAALEYIEQGYSIIPLIDKKPAIQWKKFQEEQATPEEIRTWLVRPDVNGLGIVTGKKWGLLILDVEQAGLAELASLGVPDTVSVATGCGGKHCYFKYSEGMDIKNSVKFVDGNMDIRANGGYGALPPSFFSEGKPYEWLTPFEKSKIADAPAWLLEKLSSKHKKTETDLEGMVPVGKRNDTAAKIIGKLISEYAQEDWDGIVLPKFLEWNKNKCSEPLPDEEMMAIYNSICSRERTKHSESEEKLSKSEKKKMRAVNLILAETKLFLDETGTPYGHFKVKNHWETLACESKKFRRWIIKLVSDKEGQIITQDLAKSVVEHICSMATFEYDEINLNNRIAYDEGNNAIIYDLCDNESNVIKICPDNWKIIANSEPIFKRFTHQAPQVKPLERGDIKLLSKYVNLSKASMKMLFEIYTVSCFIPNIPHPIPILYGSQGSSKSTTSKVIKKIVDPSRLDISSLSKDKNELIQILGHHYLVCFDNLSYLPPWATNLFCTAATGGGFSKRELYTNDDDVIYNFRRCIILNGINLVSNQPDLLDRALLFDLERIDEKKRKTEKEFWDNFNADLPAIMAGVFDTLVKAMEIFPKIDTPTLTRMADFYRWGCAIAQALGYTQEDFIAAYEENIKEQNSAVLVEDIVASAVISFMETQSEWEGTASNLLDDLGGYFSLAGKSRFVPNNHAALSKRLNVVKSNLAAAGIIVENYKDTEGRRGRFIRIINNKASLASSSKTPSDLEPDDKGIQLAIEGFPEKSEPCSDDSDDKIE